MKRKLVIFILFSVLFTADLFCQFNPYTNRFDTIPQHNTASSEVSDNLTDFSNFQGLLCVLNSFWAYGNQSIDEYVINGNNVSKTGAKIDKANTVSGIAFVNNLNGNSFSPTLYSADLVKPYYFDGTGWIAANDSVPEFILNPGGSGNFLYYVFYNQLTTSKSILRYNGSGFKNIYTYLPGVIPTIADLAVDNQGNVWTFTGLNDNKLHTDSLLEISPFGKVLNRYAFSFNSVHAYGCFTQNNTIYIGLGSDNPDNPSSLVPVTIENGIVKAGKAIPFVGDYSDLAACNAGNPLAVNELEELKGFTIFPNPVKENISIKAPNNYNERTSIIIYSLCGQKLKECKFDSFKDLSGTSIDISSLQQGVYIMTITSKTQQSSFKIIKEQ